MTTRQQSIPSMLVVLLLVVWAILLIRMSAPYYGIQDAFRVWIAATVRNYDLYGYETTGMMMVRNTAPVMEGDHFDYYSHHPAMLAWVPRFFTELFGFHEVGVRFGFIAATMLSVSAMYVVARRLYNRQVALWAAFFFSLSPMILYFGRVPGMSQLSMAVFLIFGAVLINWTRQPTRSRFVLLVLLAWLAVWTAWSAVFFVAFLGFAAMLLGNWRQRVGVPVLGVVTVAAFVTLMLLYEYWWSGSIESLLNAFVWRTSSATLRPESESFGVLEWLRQNITHTAFFTTFGFFILSLMGITSARRRGNHFGNVFLLVGLFGASLAYQLAFRNASYIHDYYKAFFVPSMAITAAMAVIYLRNQPRYKRFIKPLVDVLVVTAVLNSVLVMAILHLSGVQPEITRIIDYINTHAPENAPVVILRPEDETNDNNQYPIEFYTMRQVYWNRPVTAQGVLRIDCREGALDHAEADPIDDTCAAYPQSAQTVSE